MLIGWKGFAVDMAVTTVAAAWILVRNLGNQSTIRHCTCYSTDELREVDIVPRTAADVITERSQTGHRPASRH